MAYCALTNLFGREIHDYMIVVFTGADECGSTIGMSKFPLLFMAFTYFFHIKVTYSTKK